MPRTEKFDVVAVWLRLTIKPGTFCCKSNMSLMPDASIWAPVIAVIATGTSMMFCPPFFTFDVTTISSRNEVSSCASCATAFVASARPTKPSATARPRLSMLVPIGFMIPPLEWDIA